MAKARLRIRSDVYAKAMYVAEDRVFLRAPHPEVNREICLDEARDLAQRVTGRAVAVETARPRKVYVAAAFVSTGKIRFFGRRGLRPWIVIHEACHIASPVLGHGPAFADLYLKATREFIGFEWGAKLKWSFRIHGVPFSDDSI
ncbi:MAG TPA: hypothetical protein VM285_06970 [Polyangia bacterium]|nr:hypothetical protein [Polyangia bacterium]